MRLAAFVLSVIAATMLGAATSAQNTVQNPTPDRASERKPPVPAGRDPGGVAVALIGTGIDYTLPEVARRLARDGEGELIGWDLEDRDRKPLDKDKGSARPELGGDGTLVASLLLATQAVRLVPVRIDPGDPLSLARALAFVAQTPARIAVLPMWGTSPGEWEPFRQAALRFKEVLIVVPAGSGSTSAEVRVYPAALGLDNVLAVAQGTASTDAAGFGGTTWRVSGAALAVAAAGRAAAELLAREPGLEADALARRLSEAGGGAMWQAQR